MTAPSPSPRERRRERQKSEETHGSMSIEEYFVRTDVFRSTSLIDPLPYPLSSSEPPQELKQRMDRIHDEITDIVRKHGILSHWAAFVNVSKPGYPGDAPVPTLKFNIHNTDMESSFGPLKDEIQALLCQNELQNISIDISELWKRYTPSLFVIEPTDPAIPVYREIRREVLKMVEEDIADDWESMSLFNVGNWLEESSPSIVIHVRPRTICDWSRLRARIATLVSQVDKEGLNIDVEFIPGACREVSADRGVTFEDRMGETFVPEMGCSIGGAGGAGTLGLFATLQIGNTVHKGFLTNHHVVRAKGVSQAEKDYSENLGVPYSAVTQSRPDVQYPAANDVVRTRTSIESIIGYYENGLEKLIQRKREKNLGIMETEKGLDDLIETYEEFRTKWKVKLENVKALPDALGQVLVSSGRTVENNHISDWAFVELLASKVDQIFRSNITPRVPDQQQPCDYGFRRVALEGIPVECFGTITPGQWYYKCGRTTNLTAGRCNGVESYANWKGTGKTPYDANGQASNAHTEVFVIVTMHRCSGPKHTQLAFCGTGDSGSAILNMDGELCGLLFGEINDWDKYSAVGLVSCMSHIASSIEQKTRPRDEQGNPVGVGGRLRLP
ncbi:hypothetical protein FQN50_005561 [Emmonsiellopsis sp. PD_5]|nr:hypothetical protein FQN50_005561 [Emmonsiellopsis sp. PD_5]